MGLRKLIGRTTDEAKPTLSRDPHFSLQTAPRSNTDVTATAGTVLLPDGTGLGIGAVFGRQGYCR